MINEDDTFGTEKLVTKIEVRNGLVVVTVLRKTNADINPTVIVGEFICLTRFLPREARQLSGLLLQAADKAEAQLPKLC